MQVVLFEAKIWNLTFNSYFPNPSYRVHLIPQPTSRSYRVTIMSLRRYLPPEANKILNEVNGTFGVRDDRKAGRNRFGVDRMGRIRTQRRAPERLNAGL